MGQRLAFLSFPLSLPFFQGCVSSLLLEGMHEGSLYSEFKSGKFNIWEGREFVIAGYRGESGDELFARFERKSFE